MKWSTTFLRSKVARRVFLLFVYCALVPIAILSAISFYHVSQQLHTQSQRQLSEMSKSQGMLIDERLQSLDGDLELIARQSGPDRLSDFREPIKDHFVALAIFSSSGTPVASWGKAVANPMLSPADQSHMESGKSLVKIAECDEPFGNCIHLVRMVDAGKAGKQILVGEINPEYLWVRQHLTAGLEACVKSTSGTLLFCSNPDLASAKFTLAKTHSASGFFQWDSDHTLYDAAFWTLPLRPGFHTDSWVVMVGQKHEEIVAPIRNFRNSFPLVALLAFWVVALVSSVQIRRTLVPLEKLERGTLQVSQQHFNERVEVNSGDEFETLANSFNAMTVQLGRQFHALKTINEIDQAIFASLNREGIVDAVLDHMPLLLPCDCVALAVFGNDHSSGTLRFRNSRAADARGTTSSPPLSAADSNRLRDNATGLITSAQDTPEFLAPLRAAGMTSFLVLPLVVDKEPFGALIAAHANTLQLAPEDVERARQVADQIVVAFSNVQLMDAMEQLHWGTLTALARAIDAKSAWTAGHSERVTNLAMKIGRAMNLSPADLRIMQRGGLLHDVGKIGTPPGILDKAGRLDAQEMDVMQDHVRIGVRILEPIAAFREALPIVAQHHEWYNGTGYPNRLAGENISLQARLFAVADVYDALTSDRPYRKGLPPEQALQMIREKSGTQFDPKVVEVFLRLCEEHPEIAKANAAPCLAQAAAAGQGSQ